MTISDRTFTFERVSMAHWLEHRAQTVSHPGGKNGSTLLTMSLSKDSRGCLSQSAIYDSNAKILSGMMIFLCLMLVGCGSTELSNTAFDRGKIQKGKKLYLSYGCAVCHGKDGDGKGIASLQYSPLAIDLHDPKAYRHGNTKEAMRRTIKYGVQEEGRVMPAFDHITDQELDILVDFLVSLQKEEQ